LIDLAVSGTALVLLSPVMLVAALAVRLTSPGPILFTQDRIGQDGKLIVVPKFRSMADVPKSESDNEWTSDKRVTPVGNFLRRTAIDELPQLFLIFKGDMSLVGPRPERPSFVEQFADQYPDYQHRHRMTVGLTGLAQVAGLVGDTSIAERVKYDNIYIDQWTLGMDLQIIFKTVWSILRQSEYKARQQELEHVLEQTPRHSSSVTASRDIPVGLAAK
jgi:lipopolysaccharide/colanic/teichoic acid biosynthesis glycosyltransferase